MRTNRTGNIKPETRNAMLDQLALAAERIIALEEQSDKWLREAVTLSAKPGSLRRETDYWKRKLSHRLIYRIGRWLS